MEMLAFRHQSRGPRRTLSPEKWICRAPRAPTAQINPLHPPNPLPPHGTRRNPGRFAPPCNDSSITDNFLSAGATESASGLCARDRSPPLAGEKMSLSWQVKYSYEAEPEMRAHKHGYFSSGGVLLGPRASFWGSPRRALKNNPNSPTCGAAAAKLQQQEIVTEGNCDRKELRWKGIPQCCGPACM
ncbi:hypothetical protein SKAU_G00041340 [Synaphobranchus kaupii]|uniref:Uncharacterized protein n=1 Tax=Synaphobranchus kaupii TaxID=118154 RepID=A0A9Q1G267_SYNKA|nr:hypothetical protein SKAU_G00041340 [Synaphobranchus kaupii]